MAQRRMFSPDIVCSDAFLDMSATSRDLYYQLGMYADDDGFVNPRKIMRMLGSSEDDLKILIAKRFVLPFPSGVLVIKHWKINNLVRKDWYRPTQYLEEKNLLKIKENGAYSELVNESLTIRPRRLGKVRLGKVSIDNNIILHSDATSPNQINEIIKLFETINPNYERLFANTTERSSVERLIRKFTYEKLCTLVGKLANIISQPYAPKITTPYQLERDMGKLQAFLAQAQNSNSKHKIAII